MAPESTRTRGSRAENVAVDYMRGAGYDVLDQNFYTRFGEIDIVARTAEGSLVFVEVKYRRSTCDGGGLAAVTPKKLATIRLVAGLWLVRHRARYGRGGEVRIDVIDVGPDGVREHLEGVW